MNYFSKLVSLVRIIGLFFLGITVLVAPWCYGSIHASVQQWLFWSVGISLVCGTVALCLDWQESFRFPWLLVPILLILLMVGLQLRPHEHAKLLKLSPKAAELREQLLPAPDSPEFELTRSLYPSAHSSIDPAPKSIYPAATRHQLSLFALVVSVFVSAFLLFRNRISIFVFSICAAVNGVILAMIGMIMRLSPYGPFFFFYNNNYGVFSTFLNRNNAAGYLGLCFGIAMVFLLWYIFRADQENENNQRWDRRFEQAYLSTRQKFLYRVARYLTPGVLLWTLAIAVLVAGVFISLSRGGILSMCTALLLGGLVIFATRRFRLSLLGLALTAVFGISLVFWAGMDERVQKRIESIFTADNSARPVNWGNAIETARDFHWRGTGFGTYQYANLLNDEFSKTNQIFVRAENQYIEIFLDLGIWGLVLFLVCLGISLVLCWRLIWQRKNDWLTALGGGIFIAVLTQVFASLFDFGLYITANAMLLAVLCGILSAVPLHRDDHEEDDEFVSRFPLFALAQRVGILISAVFFLFILAWGHREIMNIHHIDVAMKRIEAMKDPQEISLEELADAVAAFEKVIQKRPDDAVAQTALGESQVLLFRTALWQESLQNISSMTDAEKWNRTSLKSMHANLGMLRRLSLKKPLNTMRDDPAVEKFLVPAFQSYVQARQSNPMSNRTHFRIAELLPLLDKGDRLQDFEGAIIERMTVVTPLSAVAWFEAGILERNLGHSAKARACWKQSLLLSGKYLQPIVSITKIDLRGDNAKDLLHNTFPDSPELYHILATRYFTRQSSPDFYETVLELFQESIHAATETTNAERHYYQGSYYYLTAQYESAIKEFSAACQANRFKHEWRYLLAKAYYENKDYENAIKEMDDILLLYAPTNKTYQNFMQKVKNSMRQ